MRHICYWQHQLLQEEDGQRRGSLWSLLGIWARNCSYLDCLTLCCIKWSRRTHKNNDGWICLKVRQSFRIPASWKSLPDILQDTEESCWWTANIGRTVFGISCFIEKSVGYYGPVSWKWMPQRYRRTLGDCPGSEMSLSFLKFWKLLTMYVLFT